MNSTAIGIVELDLGEQTVAEGGNFADPRLALDILRFGVGIAVGGYYFGHDVVGPLIFGR